MGVAVWPMVELEAQLLNRYGALESFPPGVLSDHDLALRFKDLATLRTDAPLF